MSGVFADTSALYALLVAEDPAHPRARAALALLEREKSDLVSSSFVIHETVTLLQARVGLAAVQALRVALLPQLEVVAVDSPLLEQALEGLLAAANRGLSITDWTSFLIMRSHGLRRAFAFDRHFTAQGFEIVAP